MKIFDESQVTERSDTIEEKEFKFDFISRPWDDRTTRSKIGIVALLVSIAIAILAGVISNFLMHYRGFQSGKLKLDGENKCHLVKMDEYKFVARIYSVATNELLCVGAVVGDNLVLADEICAKSGTIRIYVGSHTNPQCKKGHMVDIIETIDHDGLISRKLVLLSSRRNIGNCGAKIKYSSQLDWKSPAYIIGRPFSSGVRALSRQPVELVTKENCTNMGENKMLNKTSTICVKDLGHCFVRAGDLLVQHGRLLGIASTSVHRHQEKHKFVHFANLIHLNTTNFEIR